MIIHEVIKKEVEKTCNEITTWLNWIRGTINIGDLMSLIIIEDI